MVARALAIVHTCIDRQLCADEWAEESGIACGEDIYHQHCRRYLPPEGIGNTVAAAVIASRRNDGSNQYGDLTPGGVHMPITRAITP
jgi:hypothetical protein